MSGQRGFYDSQGRWRPLYSTSWPSVSAQVSRLTRASDDRFPYPLRPRGWSRRNDPFEAEARKRLAGAS